MLKKSTLLLSYSLIVTLLMLSSIYSRAEFDVEGKNGWRQFTTVKHADCRAAHRIGNIVLGINNNGTIGNGFTVAGGGDCFTGGQVQSCEYPKGSNISHLFAGAFWVGAIIGRDTAVSLGADGWNSIREFAPDVSPFGDMIYRSNTDPDNPRYEDAVSEEDYICTYSDTFTAGIDPDFFGQAHIPLYIGVTERSYAWSYSYAEDFVLFDYTIKNIGTKNLDNVYMGFYVDADVGFLSSTGNHTDDIAGFLETIVVDYKNCQFLDTVNIAWTADMDGDFNKVNSSPDLTAMRIVRTPAESLVVSFNWWVSNGNSQLDFGPRKRTVAGEILRDFGTGGLGTPEGDKNKYYILSNGEFDYDQAYVGSIQQYDPTWIYPLQSLVNDWAEGLDTRYLLSFGPFDIRVGQTLPISFAYMGGEGLHTDRNNARDNMPHDPDAFYNNMHFEDLALNSAWAEKVYDNPGIDTDGDGYYGEFRICEIDSATIDTDWYRGDGVPDFKGAAPPPPPVFWLSSGIGYIKIRFNGARTETEKDIFTREVDFEGYRIYIARDERAQSYNLIASYDREDYNMYVFDTSVSNADWELAGDPFLLEELQTYFNDDNLDPLIYSRSSPYISPLYPGLSYYFSSQDYNYSEQGVTKTIRKIYPDQPYPTSIIADSARPDELTEDGYLKFFEYEYLMEDLLPTVEYYINVTAFDFGSPSFDLGALESSVTFNAKSAYAQASIDQVLNEDIGVVVYPNPYRLDANYRGIGFEGRNDADRPDDRVRGLHFANIPPKCRISIFTIDGDLVKEFDHDVNPSDPKSTHETWDMITRNTQMIVSGLYYYVIEADNWETHIGKFAVIM